MWPISGGSSYPPESRDGAALRQSVQMSPEVTEELTPDEEFSSGQWESIMRAKRARSIGIMPTRGDNIAVIQIAKNLKRVFLLIYYAGLAHLFLGFTVLTNELIFRPTAHRVLVRAAEAIKNKDSS